MPAAAFVSAMPAPDIPEHERPWRRQATLQDEAFKVRLQRAAPTSSCADRAPKQPPVIAWLGHWQGARSCCTHKVLYEPSMCKGRVALLIHTRTNGRRACTLPQTALR